jgi:hypothetical protein
MAEMLQGYESLQRRIAAIKGPMLGKDIMTTLGHAVVNEAGNLAPHKTGNLRRTVHVTDVTDTSAKVVASANYAAFVEYGTGLFGPLHHKITPTAKKAMRWMAGPASAFRLSGSVRSGKAGAAAGAVFARSTKGMKAEPFLEPGAEKAIKSAGLLDRVVLAWNKAG